MLALKDSPPVLSELANVGRNQATRLAEKDPFAVALGRRIQNARKRAEMTQRDLSKKARYDAVQLSRVETGEAIPRADALLRIAQALEAPVGELYGVVPPAITPPADARPQELEARVASLEKGLVTALATAGDALALAQRLEQQRGPRRTRASGS